MQYSKIHCVLTYFNCYHGNQQVVFFEDRNKFIFLLPWNSWLTAELVTLAFAIGQLKHLSFIRVVAFAGFSSTKNYLYLNATQLFHPRGTQLIWASCNFGCILEISFKRWIAIMFSYEYLDICTEKEEQNKHTDVFFLFS